MLLFACESAHNPPLTPLPKDVRMRSVLERRDIKARMRSEDHTTHVQFQVERAERFLAARSANNHRNLEPQMFSRRCVTQ